MPELPEVETTARGLRPRLVGRRVVDVSGVDWPRMLPNTSEPALNTLLRGCHVTCVDRRGKYLLLGFDADRWLAIHRNMSGNVLLQSVETRPPRHTHLQLTLDDATALRLVDARKFGRVYAFEARSDLDVFMAARLGPEPLSEFDASTLANLLRGRRARIKSLLLDQAFVAGVGNLYADEALWRAQLHPLRAADSLSSEEIARLADAIQSVLSTAIERRGTSFSDYVDADGEPGDNQQFLNVYGRADQPCPRCGHPISRILVAQRGTHVCPHCQI